MNLFLSRFTGTGTRRNPFRVPCDGSMIDLRPDCTVQEGWALVSTDETPVGAVKLGEGFRDTFGTRTRNRVHNLLGVDVSRVARFDVLAATLLMRPNGWNPLRPGRDRYEIWLGGLVWDFPLVRGGASDNFNRANETPLAAPWTATGGSFNQLNLVSNQAVAAGIDSDSSSYYAAAASSADQYSQATLGTVTGDVGGPAVRCGSNSLYDVEPQTSTTAHWNKFVSGGYTDLLACGGGLSNPVRLEVEGSNLRAYANGVGVPNNPKTDTSITTGQPGLFLFKTAVGADDWSGGDLTPASGPVVAWIRA